MKPLLSLFVCAALAACSGGTAGGTGGGGTTSVSALGTYIATPTDLPASGTVTLSGYKVINGPFLNKSSTASSNFTFDASSHTLTWGSVTLTWNGTDAYVGSDSSADYTAYFYDDPTTPGAFIVKLSGAPSGGGSGGTSTYYAMNTDPTPGASFNPPATAGTASYTGSVQATDDSLNTHDGTINLAVNVTSAQVSGDISLQTDSTAFSGATFSIDTATVTKGTSTTTFSSTLTPTSGLTATGSNNVIDGSFGGASGQYAVGGFLVDTSVGSLAGGFLAKQ